jgi:hypothetical protein
LKEVFQGSFRLKALDFWVILGIEADFFRQFLKFSLLLAGNGRETGSAEVSAPPINSGT